MLPSCNLNAEKNVALAAEWRLTERAKVAGCDAAQPYSATTMKLEEIAQGLVKLCKKGRYSEAIEKYYADDIVSVEPAGEGKIVKGLAAVKAKTEHWMRDNKVHKSSTEGPFVGKGQFVVRFTVDLTFKPTGKRLALDELGIYTVRRSKIVHEQFFYHAGE
jgi:hypothetical protein